PSQLAALVRRDSSAHPQQDHVRKCTAGAPRPRMRRSNRSWARSGVLVRGRDLELALGDLFERHRQEVLRPRLDQWRREALEAALAELVVVIVDLARALGGGDHQGVLAVHVLEQHVNLGMDHSVSSLSTVRISSVSWDAARSRSSFTITY